MYSRVVAHRPEGPYPLPPLNALRTFEAVARHASFTRAAEELCVTQTAVSHQVRALEASLGTTLFRRLPRRIELTDEGRAWADALGDAFARIYAANRRLRGRRASRPTLSVSILPSFASRWLVPRLGRFVSEHPELELRISTSEALVDFAASPEVDLGIRYGRGDYPSLSVDLLYEDSWVVVCAPSLRGRAGLRTVDDLGRFPLLRDDDPDAWRIWLDAHGARAVDAAGGSLLTDSSMVVDAAVNGQGVALVRLSLAADELAAGRLVRPFPRVGPMPTGSAYRLVGPRHAMGRPEVAAFRAWIREEIRTLAAAGEGRVAPR